MIRQQVVATCFLLLIKGFPHRGAACFRDIQLSFCEKLQKIECFQSPNFLSVHNAPISPAVTVEYIYFLTGAILQQPIRENISRYLWTDTGKMPVREPQ